VHPTHFLVCVQATLIFKVELVGIKDRTKGSGESDRERLAQLRAEREQAAAEAKAKKEALKAASADKQNALKECAPSVSDTRGDGVLWSSSVTASPRAGNWPTKAKRARAAGRRPGRPRLPRRRSLRKRRARKRPLE